MTRDARISQQLVQAANAIFVDDHPDFSILPRSITAGIAAAASTGTGIHSIAFNSIRVAGLLRIGGLDISFRPPHEGTDREEGAEQHAVATLSIVSYPSFAELRPISCRIVITERYEAGFLSFREAIPLAALLDELDLEVRPQLLFVDGNGSLHEREAGSAVVIGQLTNIPTIGIAKEFHPVFDPTRNDVEEYEKSQKGMRKEVARLLKKRGDWMAIRGFDRSAVGAALLSSPCESSTRAIFVSPGHRVSLETAVGLASMCCINARVPEPIRLADATGRAEVKRIWPA